MAHHTPHTGVNRTGIRMSPIDTTAMLSNDNAPLRGTPGDEGALRGAREATIHDADIVGSIAPPRLVTSTGTQVLLDKLGERLAFERAGTRLYDALLAKCNVLAHEQSIVEVELVSDMRRDEARHFLIVKEAIEQLGGDPTSQTPSADIAGVEGLGLLQVLNDARTSLAQSLHALLTAELADGAGWETLIALAGLHGHRAMAARFGAVLEQENRHLARVTGWYHAALGLPPQGGAG